MKTFKGKPITGAKPQNKPQGNVLTNPNNPSAEAQNLIKRPAMPFQSKQAPANAPAPQNPRATVNVGDGKSANTAGFATGSKPGFGAVGDGKPGGYNKVVGGQKGLSHPRKLGAGHVANSQPSKRNARFFGQ